VCVCVCVCVCVRERERACVCCVLCVCVPVTQSRKKCTDRHVLKCARVHAGGAAPCAYATPELLHRHARAPGAQGVSRGPSPPSPLSPFSLAVAVARERTEGCLRLSLFLPRLHQHARAPGGQANSSNDISVLCPVSRFVTFVFEIQVICGVTSVFCFFSVGRDVSAAPG